MEEFLRKYLKKYREQIIPTALLATSMFVFFRMTIPQFSNVVELRRELQGKEDDVSFLQSSLNTISNLNESQIDDQLALMTSALPQDKNLSLIFTSLTQASENSNTLLESFSLDVGQVYEAEEESAAAPQPLSNTPPPPETNDESTPSIQSIRRTTEPVPKLEIIATVNGSSQDDLLEFARQIQNSLPVAQVTELSVTDDRARFLIEYFYKPLDTVGISNRNVVPDLKQADLEILQQMEAFSS